MHRYFVLYKPFRILSQFTSAEGKRTLKDVFDVPRDLYPVGRLDYDSEGLLILTNDAALNHRLLDPRFAHEREYWVQVEGRADLQAIDKLQRGVVISIDGKAYKTRPCRATLLPDTPQVPERVPPIRFRARLPTSWISMTLTEGKNRQVRKMTASVGLPTLRLIRHRIEKISLDGLLPGEMREMKKQEIYPLLFTFPS
ncbi:MAG: pseudouridine synthase [Bacteroidota bacterium]|nr:pseudouridine synthase [Bacteroidota bacterium]MDP4215546.1 pseudouridine synthase [Bacteroidota bacterium]MDP4245176.1 pseudouridine synthase [Bacteroidota bacterium]MDP4256443.1 pseudouridine synthase [Bacteroidota bacterium]MDP4258238.1 pseudouridine synthase [Bacteroidota bacterium]